MLFDLNAGIRKAAGRGDAQEPELLWEFRCECGAAECGAMVEVGLAKFDELQATGRPILANGHTVSPAASARRKAAALREEAAALQAQARHQQRRAHRNATTAGVERSLIMEVPTSSYLAAVDLEVRLQSIARARVTAAAESTVHISTPQPHLRDVLSRLSEWLDDFEIAELEIQLEQRSYTLQRRAGRVHWVDVTGTELDDIEVESPHLAQLTPGWASVRNDPPSC